MANVLAQVTLLAVLHHDEKVCRLGVEIHKRADVRMLQKKEQASLLEGIRRRCSFILVAQAHDLLCDILLAVGLARDQECLSGAAVPYLLDNRVRLQL